MSPKQTYELYLALKLHFTSDYNFQKYNGKMPAKVVDSLSKKGGMRFDMERIGKQRDPRGFLLSNILYDPDWTPFKSRDTRSKDVYSTWKKHTDALRYTFEQDLNKLLPNFSENLWVAEGRPPSLLLTYAAGHIAAETVSIILDQTGYGKKWISDLRKMDHPYTQTAFRLYKYIPFIEYQREVYYRLIIDKFNLIKKDVDLNPAMSV